MAIYTEWERVTLGLFTIDLDLFNPRLEAEPLTQNDILDILLDKRFKIIDLAKSIAAIGFTPLDNIIVYLDEKTGRYTVLEGNRRIAALQLLLNPKLARNPMLERTFEKIASLISESEKKALREIDVIVAPNRHSADKLLLNRHTTKPIESWTPIMQAKFVYERAENVGFGKAVHELSISQDDFRKFIRRYQYYKLSQFLLERDFVENKFPITSLERLLDVPDIRTYLGMEQSEQGELSISSNSVEFREAFESIVNAVKDGGVTSRTLNSRSEAIDWIKKNILKPKTSNKNTPIKDFYQKPFVSSSSTSPPPSPEPRPAPPTKLFPENLECECASPRLKSITDELKKMPLSRYPNAIAVAYRTFLEVACWEFIQYKDLGDRFATFKNRKNNSAKGDLANALGFLGDQSNNVLPKNLARAIGRFKNKENFNSISTMQEYSHNTSMVPTKSDLIDIWSLTEEFVRYILRRDN